MKNNTTNKGIKKRKLQ